MKYSVKNVDKALEATGGCTYEANIGWWTYSESIIPEFTEILDYNRDALYLPTLTKTGNLISSHKLDGLKKLAQFHGFNKFIEARGLWISDADEIQSERIWIAWSNSVSNRTRKLFPSIAKIIKYIADQYCVAWENHGQLKLVD